MGYGAQDAKTQSEDEKIYGGSSPQNDSMTPCSTILSSLFSSPFPPYFELFNKANSSTGMNMLS